MRIGFVSLPLSGHLNPMTALARTLQSRGNDVVFLGVPDAGPAVRAAKLRFVPLGETEYPVGSIANRWGGVAKLHGEDVVRYSLRELLPDLIRTTFEHLPEILVETGVEALVIDTIYFFVELVPMTLGLPYVHVWNVLHIDRSGLTPPCFFSWPYRNTPEALARNGEGMKRVGGFLAPVLAVAKSYAEEHALQIDWDDPIATTSKLAVITQTPREFDFPGSHWPSQFHYAGPFHDGKGRAAVPFPWERLTNKPLIYASLGSLVNGLEGVYRNILGAVATLPEIQLVLSVGNSISLSDLGRIPSNTIVVRTAPQIELLKRAALCITHAGLNTALESLALGVPMVAIPIGYDQPGVAARIAHHGVGEFVEVGDLTAERLSELIRRVRTNPGYRERARYFQRVVARTRGLDVAAGVIERAFEQNQAATSVGKRAASAHA